MWRYEFARSTVADAALEAFLVTMGDKGWDARSLRLDQTKGEWDVILRRVITERAQAREMFERGPKPLVRPPRFIGTTGNRVGSVYSDAEGAL